MSLPSGVQTGGNVASFPGFLTQTGFPCPFLRGQPLREDRNVLYLLSTCSPGDPAQGHHVRLLLSRCVDGSFSSLNVFTLDQGSKWLRAV